jgi:hypothetical protein
MKKKLSGDYAKRYSITISCSNGLMMLVKAFEPIWKNAKLKQWLL